MLKNLYLHIVLLGVVAIATGCSSKHELAPSPNIYVNEHNYPDKSIPKKLQTTKSKILYMTDRKINPDGNAKFSYDTERSRSMALGEATILFGNNISWETLKKASATKKRDTSINLEVASINEILRFPPTPLPFSKEAQAAYRDKSKKFQNILREHLKHASKKEVLLFVHGFNNTFDEAALRLAEIWHFSNRTGVPLLYTWPAGASGLMSYFTDRESGEFTIFHLKETIRMIAKTPGLKKIHIIAHSRGTDVATSALRELVIEENAKGNDPRETLKIENLIMAAPDLDFGVASQRLIAEKFGLAFGQITVYANQSDNALSLSQYLMSGTRFGRIQAKDLPEDYKKIFKQVKNVNFIDVEYTGGFMGHAYFRENPGVLSDISIVIQNSSIPGSKERPLKNISGNFWLLEKGYPFY